MNWSDERYVRLFTRDTLNWKRMGWQARCVLVMLMRRVDRSGVLELGDGWKVEDLAEVLDLPAHVCVSGYKKLKATGTVTASGFPPGIALPNFLEAQETRQTDA